MPSWPKLLLVCIAAAALGSVLLLGWPSLLVDEQRVNALVAQHGPLGLLALIGLGACYTAAGGPRQVLAFAVGYALGPWRGLLFALVATVAGAALCYGIARLALHRLLENRFPRQLSDLDAFLGHRTWIKIVAIRFAPVGSNLLTNALAGVLRLKPSSFLLGSAIGYLPQTLAFSLAGAGIGPTGSWHIWAGIALFVLAAAASYPLNKHPEQLRAES